MTRAAGGTGPTSPTGAPRSPRSGGDHAKHANHRGVPQSTWSVWTACSATEHAECRGAPRSAAERRGAPRSAAERRGAPRSAAEHAKYVAARAVSGQRWHSQTRPRLRQTFPRLLPALRPLRLFMGRNLRDSMATLYGQKLQGIHGAPFMDGNFRGYASAAGSAGIARSQLSLSQLFGSCPQRWQAAFGTFGVALGAFGLGFAMPALQVAPRSAAEHAEHAEHHRATQSTW
eukprot:gene13040-biopygen11634